jgi:hypothetical protein
MTYPNDENGAVLTRMAEHGFDFTIPHDVDFFAVLGDEEMANQIARQFVTDRERGEPIRDIETYPAEKGGMELRVVRRMQVTHAEITSFEERLAYRVAQHDGYLAGWGVLQD